MDFQPVITDAACGLQTSVTDRQKLLDLRIPSTWLRSPPGCNPAVDWRSVRTLSSGQTACNSLSVEHPAAFKLRQILAFEISGGSRKKNIWGPGPSSFGRQPRLSEITIEPISGVLLNIQVGIRQPRNVAPSRERSKREDRGAERCGVLGRGCPLPSRLGSLEERRELPQRRPG